MEILQECTIATFRTLDKFTFRSRTQTKFFLFWFYGKVSFSVGFVLILTVKTVNVEFDVEIYII